MREDKAARLASMDGQMALPRQNGELLFQAPWEARAFGIAVALNEAGAYAWRQFSQGLAAETAAAEQQGHVETGYYERWLDTLEKLAIAQNLVTPEELAQRVNLYALEEDAEHATPAPEHGPHTAT